MSDGIEGRCRFWQMPGDTPEPWMDHSTSDHAALGAYAAALVSRGGDAAVPAGVTELSARRVGLAIARLSEAKVERP